MKFDNKYLTNMLLIFLGMFFTSAAFAGDFQASSLTGIFEGWGEQTAVAEGNLIQLIKTTDDAINVPNANSVDGALGAPTGDDVLLRTTHVGNGYIVGYSDGRFTKLFSHTDLVVGTKVFLRVWNTDVVSDNSDAYGDSPIYTIQSSPTVDEHDFGTFYLTTTLEGVSLTDPVELASFAANSVDGRVELFWTTQSESQNLGYFVYRADAANGTKAKLHDKMIEGALNSETRNDYTFTDREVEPEKEYFYWLADVATDGSMNFYGPVNVLVAAAPKAYGLNQNYPNPFNPTTMISYSVKKEGQVKLLVYNMLGQVVRELVNNHQAAGTYSVHWDGLNHMGVRVPSGVYFYAIDVNGFTASRKMMLTK